VGQDETDSPPTSGPDPEMRPELQPRPLPEWDDVAESVSVAKVWLGLVAADLGDARSDKAQRLLEFGEHSGISRLDEIASLAFRSACLPGSVTALEKLPYTGEMADLIYQYDEDCTGQKSPLDFLEPSPLLQILEMAVARSTLGDRRGVVMTTRLLARLARVETNVVEQELFRDEIYCQPYGISLREMDEMTSGDQLFFYRNMFVFNLKDYAGWLSKFPGFTPLEAEEFHEPTPPSSLDACLES